MSLSKWIVKLWYIYLDRHFDGIRSEASGNDALLLQHEEHSICPKNKVSTCFSLYLLDSSSWNTT